MKKAMGYTRASLKAIYGLGLLCLTLLGMSSLQAQSISPQTLTIAGGYAQVGGYSLGYSMGEESSISYYKTSAGFSLSAGFLQDLSRSLPSVANLKATVDNRIIEVKWEEPQGSTIKVEGYKIEISEDGLNFSLLSVTEKLEFTIDKLTNNQKYWIRISAYALFSSGKEKVIGPLIPIAPAIEDIVVAETQEFGEIVVVVDGQKVDPLIQTSENSVNLKVGDIVMDLGGSSESGNKLPIIDGILLLEPKGSIGLKGNGFKKNTSIAIWLVQNLSKATGGRLSEFNPYLQSRLTEENNSFLYSSKVVGAKAGAAYFLGYADVDTNGIFTSNLVIPEELISGRFTLQARGIGKGGEPASINLGAVVSEDLNLDTDGDGVPDYLETKEGSDPKDSKSYLDTDKDGVPDHLEKLDGTDPKNQFEYKDSDGEKVPDYIEIIEGTSSTNPSSYLDKDGDDVPDYIESRDNTDLGDPEAYSDTDGDLVPDYIELRDGTDVKNSKSFKDTDLDGVPDYVQVRSIKSSLLQQVILPWGTANHLSKLPTTVEVGIYSGVKTMVKVVWNKTETLNILKRGTYELKGTLVLPKGNYNPYLVNGVVRVVVLPKPAPRDVTITNSTFAGSTTNFFISVGDFVVNDPVDNIHVVNLLGDGYDNKYFEIKSNILFWSSAARAPGKTKFSIVVRVLDRDGNTLDKFFEITRTRLAFDTLTIYNTFTPNADRFNDTWGVPEIRFYEGARISVYDRGGSRLFYTENPDIRWNGSYQGKEMPVGSYFWTIEIGETGEIRRGMLNLIRK